MPQTSSETGTAGDPTLAIYLEGHGTDCRVRIYDPEAPTRSFIESDTSARDLGIDRDQGVPGHTEAT